MNFDPISTSNIITLAAAVVVIVGWFVNSHLQRRHEISRERLKHRLSMLQEATAFLNEFSYIDKSRLMTYVTTSEFQVRLQKTDILFAYYGNDCELIQWKAFQGCLSAGDYSKAADSTGMILRMLRDSTRLTLGLKPS